MDDGVTAPSHRSFPVVEHGCSRSLLARPRRGQASLYPQEFSVTSQVAGDGVALRLAGELDLVTAHVVRAAVEAAFESGARSIDLDLSHLSFVDCRGGRPIVEAVEEARERRISIVLRSPRRLPRLVLLALGLEPVLADDVALEESRPA